MKPRVLKKYNALEASIEGYLVSECNLQGWLCEKHISPGRIGPPDRIITLPCGHKPMAEVKRPKGGKVRIHQKIDHELRELTCGEIVFIPKTYEDVAALILRLVMHVKKCPALPRELTRFG